ncbi:MAG: M15 family metallopeptidase [Undibacterium sp.]
MRSSSKWKTAGLHHLTDEMARSLPSEIGFDWPTDEIWRIVSEQVVMVLPYRDFRGVEHWGQLVVHREIADPVRSVFEMLFAHGFPIGSMAPVAAFGWSDDRSMAANNCVGFHFRQKTGKGELSWHAYGRAIDINPLQNPYVRGEVVLPRGGDFDPSQPGTCSSDSLPVRLFKAQGFMWGGEWTSLRDYMHFELPFPP